MNNPVIFFYAKVYQYFNHVGIKTINLHAQASFIFSVTAFYYVYEFVNLIGLELSAPMKFALLLIEPTIHIAAYLYFNKKNVEQQLTNLAKSEDSNSNVASSLMTVALVLPMMIFFTQILFR